MGSDLGDERRSNRLVALGEALATVPAASFPTALSEGAELEGAYRFLSNRFVEPDSILEPHCRETVSRCAEQETVVIAHDTTDFVFAGEDMYDLFTAMVEKKKRFVIRSSFDRRIEGDKKIAEHLTSKPTVITREVALSKRQRSPLPKQRKIHPPRNARIATLGLKAQVVNLLKPRDLPATFPKSLTLHVVVVEEIDPPAGEPPIYWRLYTAEPIDTVADIETVVDAYRCRWRIEEFFKALKTGCAIEKRQLETGHALMNALALFTPIAWRVLRHRTLVHADADRPAKRVMNSLQIQILRKLTKKKLPRALTVAEALVAVAALGGHLKRNGPPGWITLSRGYERLLTLEEGAILATQM